MERWIFGLFLAVAAGQDLRKRRIDIWVYLLFGVLAAMSMIKKLTAADGWSIFIRMVPGLLLMGMSALSRGGIGMGDGCFFLVSGMLLSIENNLVLICYGTLLCGVYALGYMVWLRMKRGCLTRGKGTILPFLPFLLPTGIWLLYSERM